MEFCLNLFVLLTASPASPANPANPGGPAGPGQRPPGAGAWFLPAMLLALIVFMFLTARSQKKREQHARQEMFSQLAKNVRVLTVGGIVGTIMSVKDNEVVLKVDESTNTKLTFQKAAIQKILQDEQDLGGEDGQQR